MTYLLITLHVVVCIALIIIVLLQAGKGAEIGASFGAGGSQTVFGAGGGKNFMARLTTGAAIVFMLTSLTLAYFWGEPSTVMPSKVAPAAAPGGFPASPTQPAPGAQTAPAPKEQAAPVQGQSAPAPAPPAQTEGEKK